MTNSNSTSRKQWLTNFSILCALVAACSLAEAQTFIVHGKDKNGREVCESLTPVRMDKSDDQFYDYRLEPNAQIGSSHLPLPYAECKTTTMSLFQQNGSKYLSLIVVHNSFKNPCADDGRQNATFAFEELQPFNNIIRLDDENDAHIFAGKKDRDEEAPLEKAVWNWDLKRTDGMVLRLSDDPSTETFGVTITPQYDPAQNWVLRFYKPETNSYVELSLSEPFTITNKKAVELTPDVSLLSFNDVECNSQRPIQSKMLTIRNTGACTLEITRVEITPTTPSSFFKVSEGISFPILINPGSSEQLSIDFKPGLVNIPNGGIPPEGLTIEGRLNFVSNAIESPPVMLQAKIVDTQAPRLTSTCPSEPFIFDAILDEDNQIGKLITADDLNLRATDDCIAQPNLIQFVGAIIENGMPKEEFTFPHFFAPGTREVRVHAKDRAENKSTEFCDFVITVDTKPVIDLNHLEVVFEIECDKSSEREFTEEVIIRNAGTATLTLSEVKLLSENSRFTLMNRPAPGTTLASGQSLQPSLRIVFTGGNSRGRFTDNLQILSNNQGVPNSQRLLPITAIVDDEVAPVFTAFPPKLMQVCATGRNVTPVSFTVTAEDNCDTDITVVCTPASGSNFPNGQKTRVNCRAMDSQGNVVDDFFEVEVLVGGKITLKPSPAKFDMTECGKSSNLSILLKNTGICPDTIKNVIVSGPFSLLRTLPPDTIINPKDSTILRVQFMPTKTGTFDKDSLVVISGNVQRRTRDTLNAVSRDTKPPTIVCRQDTIGCVGDPSEKIKIKITASAFDICSGFIDPNNIVYTITKFNGEMRSERIDPLRESPIGTHEFPVGTTEVTCTASDGRQAASCRFTVNVVLFQPTVTITKPDTLPSIETCASNVPIEAKVKTTGNILFKIVKAEIVRHAFGDTLPAASAGDGFLLTSVGLKDGDNLIEAIATIVDIAGLCTPQLSKDVILVKKLPNTLLKTGKIVINEFLYDPLVDSTGNDYLETAMAGIPGPGQERIELKNISDEDISLDGMALWIQRGTLNTFVRLPNTVLPARSLYDIHYLAEPTADQQNDAGNFFTGLPNPAHPDQDVFSGNNSTVAQNMLLGGNNNRSPFALALIDRIDLIDAAHPARSFELNGCLMVDFLQVGGDVEPMKSIAVQNQLWQQNTDHIIPLAAEGFSYEFNEEISKTITTKASDYVAQCRPSPGQPNHITSPPTDHLLISEISLLPKGLQFIEIFNPQPKDSVLSLAGYYLSNDGDAKPALGKRSSNSYTRIVKGVDSLEVGDNDFVVHFPDTARIRGQQFITIAIASSDTGKFFNRYRTRPKYEIIISGKPGMVDNPNVPNMIVDRRGNGEIGLKESNDVVILFKWDEQMRANREDLVEDVDYVVWGKKGGVFEAIDKSFLAIDGFGDGVSFYKLDTPARNQKPIGIDNQGNYQVHSFLKSWQRRQRPREFGEPLTCETAKHRLGNGISGHNETSENLTEAFQKTKPSPNDRSGKLDLEGTVIVELIHNGDVKNKEVNPSEKIGLRIKLKNLSDEPTGPLQAVLRAADSTKPFIETGALIDSLATFPPIEGQGVRFSDTLYVFRTAARPLPDTLLFKLFITEKPPTLSTHSGIQRIAQIANSESEVDVPILAKNVFLQMVSIQPRLVTIPDPANLGQNLSLLRIEHKLKNTLAQGSGAVIAQGVTATLVKSFFRSDEIDLTKTDFDVEFSYGELGPQAPSTDFETFELVTKKNFAGSDTPKVVFKLNWSEGSIERSKSVIFPWSTLSEFKIQGSVHYFNQNQNVKRVQGATVILEKKSAGGVFVVKKDATTDELGRFSFTLPKAESGDYKISVTRAGVPKGAITPNDSVVAKAFKNANVTLSAPPPANEFELFQRIAADVTGNLKITQGDVDSIKAKLSDSCFVFTAGKDWTFLSMNPFNTVGGATAFKIEESRSISLKNFIFENVRFAGIVLGDADGMANPNATPLPCPKADFEGTVTFCGTSRNVDGVLVTLDGPKFAKFTTNADGRYVFHDIPNSPNLNYTIKLSKHNDKRDTLAITDRDLAVLDSLLNIKSFDACQLKLGDVDSSGGVDSNDRTLLLKFLQKQTEVDFRLAGQWRFYKPGLNAAPSFDLSQPIQNFVAVLGGDVSGSWTPTLSEILAKARQERGNYPFLQDLEVTPGDFFTLPLRMEPAQEIVSARLDLHYDSAQLEVVNIAKGKSLENYQLQDGTTSGHIQAGLSGPAPDASASEIFLITFRVIGKAGQSSLLELKAFNVNDQAALSATAKVSLVKKIPREYFLSQNYPNPFNPSTIIEYGLPGDEHVRLQIFNVTGQLVSILVNQRQEGGYYRMRWDGRDGDERILPAGLYLMRLQAGKFSQVRKLVLVK